MTTGGTSGPTKRRTATFTLGVIGVIIILAGIVLIPSKLSIFADSHVQASTPGDWTTYMSDNGRSGYNSTETIINPSTAPQLKLHWRYLAGGTINTQPVVVNGVIYWGSWDGYEHATDLNGNLLWQTYLGKVTPVHCTPASAGVASTATIAAVSINGTPTEVVFVGGGNAQFYALDASSGNIIWSTLLGTSPSHMIWDAPALYHGSVYIGMSSYGDCPLVRGQLFQMDTVTGTIQHTYTSQCSGAGIWGSPTIDEVNNVVYAATGNANCSSGFSVIELSATDLSIIGSWQVPPSERTSDDDFGSTPTLFQATIDNVVYQMVGVANKTGTYFAFDRTNMSAGPLWQRQIASVKGNNISPSAWDGTTLYVGSRATTVNGQSCRGSVRALNPVDGTSQWEYCAPGKVIDAVTLVPGLVIVGAGGKLVVLNAQSGLPLFKYLDSAANSQFYGAASVSNGMLYIGNKDGNLFAFGL